MEEGDWTTEEAMIAKFEEMGALLTGHFVLTSKPEGSSLRRHSGAYVNKDVVSSDPGEVYEIAIGIIEDNKWYGKVDVVAAPAIGAIVVGSMVAQQAKARFVYAESDGDEKMVFKRGFDKLIGPGKKVVIVEDIVTSGGTLKKMVKAVRELGGEIVAVVILWQRGGKDLPQDVKIISLVTREYPVWNAEECELCKVGTEVNTDVGHGEEFLAAFSTDPANWPANKVSYRKK